MAIQGGIILGVITGVLYCHYHKIDILAMMDIAAPAIVFGQGLGRCANLLNGDAFGAPTGSSFGIILGAPVLILVGVAPRSDAMCWLVLGLAALYLAILYLLIFKLRKKKKAK